MMNIFNNNNPKHLKMQWLVRSYYVRIIIRSVIEKQTFLSLFLYYVNKLDSYHKVIINLNYEFCQ